MRGINDTTKREEVMDIFNKGKFKLLALMETKLKEVWVTCLDGEVSWCGVNGIMLVSRRWKELGKVWPSC